MRSTTRRSADAENKRRDKIQLWTGIVLIGTVVLVAVSLLVYKFYFLTPPLPKDPETNCAIEGVLASHSVFLIDTTDKLSEAQVKQISANVEKIAAQLGEEDKISLHLLEDNERQPLRPLNASCGFHKGNRYTESVKQLEQKRIEKLVKPLQTSLANLLSASPGTQSPIFEAITKIAEGSDFSSKIPVRRLIIYSDLLQHSSLFSDYAQQGRKNKREKVLKAIAESNVFSNRPDFGSTELTVYYISRDTKPRIQDASHVKLWEEILAKLGAQKVAFIKL